MKNREEHIGYQIRILSNLLKRKNDSELKQDDCGTLTHVQSWVLRFLSESETDVFQRDIEKKFDVRRSTATEILKLMEKKELIIREATDYDARLKKITLTTKANDILRAIEENIEMTEQTMRNGLSDEEISEYFRIIHKMQENLRNSLEKENGV